MAAGSARVGTRRVRALLDSDRRAANEVRPEFEELQLVTADYVVPLRVRLKRSFREDYRVRVGSLVLAAGMLVALLSSLITSLGTARASQAAATAPQLAGPETTLVRGSTEATLVRSSTPTLSHQPLAAVVEEEPAAAPQGVRERLQQARQLLATQDAADAGRARTLLDELVRDRPNDGRAYAALAEACLQLADARCARDAVHKAMAHQPRRAKFRALSERIEHAFAAQGK